MGIVFLGRDPVIGRMVALKTIRAVGEDDLEQREFRERFLREAQAAGILSHPNIVTVHDVGEDSQTETSFIAMEYVEGKNLKQLLQEKVPYTYERISEIIGQVAEALDYAHRRGIVHRDVKPANIIITPEGVVKITDFGIAKIEKSNLTSTGQFLGTPNYMSPEQVTGDAVDGRSDLFSLGVVLYELITRKKPFSGENLTQISYKIVHEAFTPPETYDSSVPAELVQILEKALSKDPANRFQRGNDFALALYEYKAREEERQMLRDLGQMVAAAEKLGPMAAIDSSPQTPRFTPAVPPQAPQPAPAQPRPAAPPALQALQQPMAPPPGPERSYLSSPHPGRRLDPDATPPGGLRSGSSPAGRSSGFDLDSTPAGGRGPQRVPEKSAEWQLDDAALNPPPKPAPPPQRPQERPTPPPKSTAAPLDETGKSTRGSRPDGPAQTAAVPPRTLSNADGEGLTERLPATELFMKPVMQTMAPKPAQHEPAPRQPVGPAANGTPKASPILPQTPPSQVTAVPPIRPPVSMQTGGEPSSVENRPTEVLVDAAKMVRSMMAASAPSGPTPSPGQKPPAPPARPPSGVMRGPESGTSAKPLPPPAVSAVPPAAPSQQQPRPATPAGGPSGPPPAQRQAPPSSQGAPAVKPPSKPPERPASGAMRVAGSSPQNGQTPLVPVQATRSSAISPPPSGASSRPAPLEPSSATKTPAPVPKVSVPPPPPIDLFPDETPPPQTGPAEVKKNLSREVNSRYVFLILGGSILIAVVVAGFFLLRRSAEEKTAVPVDNTAAKNASDRRSLMEEGNRLVMEGKYAEALEKYRELARQVPDSAAAKDAVQKTEILLEEQRKKDSRLTEIHNRLQAARDAVSAGDDTKALVEVGALLVLDPQNSDALALKATAEERLKAAEKATEDQKKKDEIAKKKKPTPTVAARADLGKKVETPTAAPALPTPSTATVKITFDCPISDGHVMIRLNEREVFRKSFNFGKKSRGGLIEGSIQVPAGKGDWKFWVISADGSVRQFQPYTFEVPGGENRMLRLDLDASNKLSVVLR